VLQSRLHKIDITVIWGYTTFSLIKHMLPSKCAASLVHITNMKTRKPGLRFKCQYNSSRRP